MSQAVDFARLTTKFGLSKQTLSALSGFRVRHENARKQLTSLKEAKAEVDFAHYKNVLKNQDIVSQMEKAYSSFKPADYDVAGQLKAIDAFEQKAVSSAEETVSKIDTELKDLDSTLGNIKDARGFQDLTLQDIAKARPQISETVDTMLQKGKWTVPGYKEKFGDLNAM